MRLNHLVGYDYGEPRVLRRDHYGFLWIGTNDGLIRYDGYKYTKYLPNNSSILGSYIRDILLDSNYRLWIATKSGLSEYDFDNDTFIRYQINNQDVNFIYDIYETDDGVLWLGSDDGLYKYDGVGSFEHFNRYYDDNSLVNDLVGVRTIYQDVDDNLWLGTVKSGLLRLNYSNNTIYQHPSSSHLKWILNISELETEELLISTYSNGIYKVNKQSSDIIEIETIYSDIRVRETIKSSDSNHWFATQYHGVVVLTDNGYQKIVPNELDSRSLPNEFVYSLYEDMSGNVWFGTDDSISVGKIDHDFIKNYFQDGTEYGLTENHIFAIHQNSRGELFFGSHGAGIDKLHQDGTIKNIPLIGSDLVRISPNTNDLLEIDGRLWVASSNGLLFSDDETYFKRVEISNTHDGLVLKLQKLDESTLLVATSVGLYKLDVVSRTINQVEVLPEDYIHALYNYGDRFWVATDYKIYYLDSDLNLIKSYEVSSLGLSDVRSFVRLNSEEVAIATLQKGILILNHVRNSTKEINVGDGLPSNVIYALATDNKSNIWASTQHGIARINSTTFEIDILEIEDGIQSEEYNGRAFFKDSLGKFYFGGTEGVTSFYPQRLFKSSKVPRVLWSNFKTVKDGKYVSGISETTKINGAINQASQIELEYNDTSTIEFTSDAIIKSKRVLFSSRLTTGSEVHEWIDRTSDNRQLDISLLPPGNHYFEVKASLNGFDWSDPLGINIIKSPPPWLTWWAYLGYFMVVMLVVSYFFRIQYQKNLDKRRAQKLIKDSEERLKLALWGSRDELWDWNLVSGKIHRSNTWGILNFPKRETDETGKNSIFRNIHPKDLPSVRAALDDHRNGYTSHYEATYRIKDRDENWVWILDRGKIVEHDDDGNPLRMSGTIRNITDIKDTQEQLDLIAKAFENTSDGVFILDNEFKYQAVNKAYEKITGFKASDRKYKLFDIHSEHRSAKDVLHQIRQALILDGAWQGELEDTRASGEAYTIELKLDAVRDRLDEVTHYVGVFSDITYRKKAEQDLRRMANFDQLTGLPNRSLFQDRLKHAIALSDRTSKELILLFIDLDNFKVVNDSLGHSIGDRLLTKVAERISACVRNNDTVARLGGDEYTILLEQVEGSFVGTRVADKILDALSRPFRIQGHELVIGCSIGIAMYPDDGADVETLLRNADTAMYSAKYMDKNNYQFFTDSMNKKANTRLEMEHELRKAIPAGDIKVVYQPKIDLTTGRMMGCEALARWQHPEFGFVSPEDFITLAEETGLIYSLGESVLHQACEATANWKEHNNYTGRTAVNLSAIQFRQTGLADVVEDILSKHKLSGEDIEFELTEGMLVTNPEAAIQIMKDLRAKGYHLAIDDFGTGYASMAQLKNFPINTLKIDKTFIDDLTKDEQDANLVKAILSLASNLHLSTVAEGVEYAEQVEELQQMGCDNIQGYVYSRPISADDFANLLDENLTLEQQIHKNNNKVVNFPA